MLFRQNPALVDAPLSLQLAVNSPPKTSIKTSGATVVMTAIVKVMVLPPGQSPVQLSSMTMVLNTHNYIRSDIVGSLSLTGCSPVELPVYWTGLNNNLNVLIQRQLFSLSAGS